MTFFNRYGLLIILLIVVVVAGWFVHEQMKKTQSGENPAVGAPTPGNTGTQPPTIPGSSTPPYTPGSNGHF